MPLWITVDGSPTVKWRSTSARAKSVMYTKLSAVSSRRWSRAAARLSLKPDFVYTKFMSWMVMMRWPARGMDLNMQNCVGVWNMSLRHSGFQLMKCRWNSASSIYSTSGPKHPA